MIGVLMLSSALNVAYLVPVFAQGFFAGDEKNVSKDAPKGFRANLKEAPLFCVLPPCLTAIGCLVLFFYAGRIEAFLAPILSGGS